MENNFFIFEYGIVYHVLNSNLQHKDNEN